jgi:transcriptional regulator with XRE-family HTH domain
MDATDQQKQVFYAAVRALREQAGLTPDDLAALVAGLCGARVQRQDIENWETKHVPRSRAKLDALDAALGANGTLVAILTTADLRNEVSSLRSEVRAIRDQLARILRSGQPND